MSIMGRAFLDNQEQAHDRMDYYYDREKKLKDILTSLAEVKKILERQLKEVTDEIDKYENENFESISARDIEDAIEPVEVLGQPKRITALVFLRRN